MIPTCGFCESAGPHFHDLLDGLNIEGLLYKTHGIRLGQWYFLLEHVGDGLVIHQGHFHRVILVVVWVHEQTFLGVEREWKRAVRIKSYTAGRDDCVQHDSGTVFNFSPILVLYIYNPDHQLKE